MNLSRRHFLQSAGGVAAATFAAPAMLNANFQPGETINIAVIGAGGRARHLLQSLVKIPQTRVVAVCDIWNQAREQTLQQLKDQPGNRKAVSDYRQILDDPNVDAVLIASPDHWHAQMTIDACQAGKDVYVEKPLTHSRDEAQLIIDAQKNNQRVVQVGTQQRSVPHLQEAREIIRSGELGPIRKIHMTWNRNAPRGAQTDYGIKPADLDWKAFLGKAPDQPFDQYRFRNWRFFWDFGGGIFTDLMVHWMDTAFWMLDLELPSTAMSIGDHFQTEGLWETPDTVQTLLHFSKNNLQAYFEGTFINHRNRAMLELMGTNATLYCDRGRYEVHPERGRKLKARQRIDGHKPDFLGADFYDDVDDGYYHLLDWLECIRSRKSPSCSVEEGVRSAEAAHMANRALRSGQTDVRK